MKYALGVFVVFPFLLFVLLFVTMGGQVGNMAWFVHMPTLVAFLLAYAGVLFVTGEFKTFVKTVNALFSKRYQISREERDRGIRLLRLGVKVTIYAVVFYSIGAFIIMLGDLNDPAAFGPMVAIVLLVPMYAAAMIMVFIHPAIYILEKRQNEEEVTVINEKEVINKLLEMCYKQGISPEEILKANEINFKE